MIIFGFCLMFKTVPSDNSTTSVVCSAGVTPFQLRPYPSAQRSTSGRKRVVVRAQVLTSSPYRNQLIDQQATKQNKEMKRCAKSVSLSPHRKRLKTQHAAKKHKPEAGVDNTPCYFCEIPYCDSSVQWFKCKNCSNWVCETCAVVRKKKCMPKVFICANCR